MRSFIMPVRVTRENSLLARPLAKVASASASPRPALLVKAEPPLSVTDTFARPFIRCGLRRSGSRAELAEVSGPLVLSQRERAGVREEGRLVRLRAHALRPPSVLPHPFPLPLGEGRHSTATGCTGRINSRSRRREEADAFTRRSSPPPYVGGYGLPASSFHIAVAGFPIPARRFPVRTAKSHLPAHGFPISVSRFGLAAGRFHILATIFPIPALNSGLAERENHLFLST